MRRTVNDAMDNTFMEICYAIAETQASEGTTLPDIMSAYFGGIVHCIYEDDNADISTIMHRATDIAVDKINNYRMNK